MINIFISGRSVSGKSFSGSLLPSLLISLLLLVSISATAHAAPPSGQLTNRVIVKYNTMQGPLSTNASSMLQNVLISDKATLASVLSSSAGVQMEHLRTLSTGADVFYLNDWMDHDAIAQHFSDLAQDPAIDYIEPDVMMQHMLVPNDSRFNEQWHYFEPTGGLNLPDAWDQVNGEAVVVAVIDTGYRPHADLAANILPGFDMISDSSIAADGDGRDSDARDAGDFTLAGECGGNQPPRDQSSSWHGTHVAGTIAAVTNNNNGVAGVAHGSKIIPVRVLGKCGGFTSDIADGMIWASGGSVSGVPANLNPAQVLNLSLGGGGACSNTQQSAINTARANGATVVVAAGNSNINTANSSPANCNGVVVVAATTRSGGKASFSNFGNLVDVAAPGESILSTLNSGTTTPQGDSFAFYSGTSMSTPHVAGLAALLYEANPGITPNDVEEKIKNTARPFPATCSQCGAGIADATAAINDGGGNGGGENETVLENAVPKTGLSGSQGQEIHFTMEVPTGASNLKFVINGGSGDADLYVRFGTAPTTSSFECRPFLNGNTEACEITNVQAGTYHIMLHGFRSFSGTSLTASFDEDSGNASATELTERGLSASQSQWNNFTLNVPAGVSSLVVNISGGSGDADLYVRFGSQPSTSNYDCRPFRSNSTETCTFDNPQAGVWHFGVRAYETYSAVNLNALAAP